MTTIVTHRPRDVGYWRAAAILYGDLGTSKAYVLGLAFMLAGHSSFWYLLAISVLTLLVGISYIFIAKSYPFGGGVYTSVHERSKTLALIGAFFLVSDYLITASLSSLSAFSYLGVPYPAFWAMGSIGIIGMLNFFGPKHTGSLALVMAIPTVIVIVSLGLMSIPFLPEAIDNLQPISNNLKNDWNIFVGIVVALSGIESIANATSSMRLDVGSSNANPSVQKTSTPAIIMVILEVCIFTALLGLAMNALPGLQIAENDVNAPGYPHVRDAMLRYMGEIFAGNLFGPAIGNIFSMIVMIVISLLLLSAVNTSIIALISLLYILCKDGELPHPFQKLNGFGVPIYSNIFAFIIPIIILFFVHDIVGLANLYAIGFVGAISVNLIATSTNFKLPLKNWSRIWMFGTFIIMALIEITLFIDKPEARHFVLTVIAIGLLLRGLTKEKEIKTVTTEKEKEKVTPGGILVALKGIGKPLDYALKEAKLRNSPLHILFVREQVVVAEEDKLRSWQEDATAKKTFEHASLYNPSHPIKFLYTVTANPVHTIIEIATTNKVQQVIIGRRRGIYTLMHMLRGTTIRNLSMNLPQDIDLVIII